MADKTVKHPSSVRLFQQTAERWNELRKKHRVVCDRLWAGTIASQFAPQELVVLRKSGYLSEHDESMLRAVRRSP